MEKESQIVTVRHFEDKNALSSEGLDSGLVPDQEVLVQETSEKIIESAKELGAHHIEIFTSPQKRTSETAGLINEHINTREPHMGEVVIDRRLNGLNQGIPNLPSDYQDGDEFEALKLAWGPFWEHVQNGDIFYRFGQAEVKDGLVYEELRDKFRETGECYAEILERHLDFIHFILTTTDTNLQDKKLKVLVGHSVNMRILKEVVSILKKHESVLTPMPIGEIPENTEAYWDRSKPKIGEIEVVDIGEISSGLGADQVEQELQILRAKMVQNGHVAENNK